MTTNDASWNLNFLVKIQQMSTKVEKKQKPGITFSIPFLTVEDSAASLQRTTLSPISAEIREFLYDSCKKGPKSVIFLVFH